MLCWLNWILSRGCKDGSCRIGLRIHCSVFCGAMLCEINIGLIHLHCRKAAPLVSVGQRGPKSEQSQPICLSSSTKLVYLLCKTDLKRKYKSHRGPDLKKYACHLNKVSGSRHANKYNITLKISCVCTHDRHETVGNKLAHSTTDIIVLITCIWSYMIMKDRMITQSGGWIWSSERNNTPQRTEVRNSTAFHQHVNNQKVLACLVGRIKKV